MLISSVIYYIHDDIQGKIINHPGSQRHQVSLNLTCSFARSIAVLFIHIAALTAGSGSLADYDVVKNFYADNEGQPLRTQKKNGKFYEKQDEQQEKEHGSLKHRFHNAMGTINHFFSSAPSSPFLTPSKISITIVTVHLITICIETHKRYFLKYY